MGCSDILDNIGGIGLFQIIHVTLLSIPGLFMSTQNLLNNFTGGIPGHHCYVPNGTSPALEYNISVMEVNSREILRAYIPMEDGSKPSKCKRFTKAQWHLVMANMSAVNTHVNFTEAETETCQDGWTYDRTEFEATIVSEVSSIAGINRLCQQKG